jgi:hypothetical protein
MVYPTLWGKQVVFDSTFYPPKIDRYCLKPTADTTIEMGIDSSRKNCITALDYSGVLGEDCAYHSYLQIQNMKKDTTYYIIEAKLKTSTTKTNYSITFVGNNFEVGICPTEALGKVANIDPKDLSLMLTFAGLFTGLIFFGGITYIFLTIKEW